WGSIALSGSRIAQIRAEGDNTWKEYNASFNTSLSNAAVFTVTGKTEQLFEIRVKAGSTFSYINVLDITSGPVVASPASLPAPVAEAELSTLRNGITPNPAKGSTRLNLDNEYKGVVAIRLLQVNGREIRRWRVTKTAQVLAQELSLAGLAQGVYLIEVQMNDRKTVFRLLKD
ncbi:MAG: T9SS type A sorting domain-containing protein, partial [Chitinophagaceae bacterium]